MDERWVCGMPCEVSIAGIFAFGVDDDHFKAENRALMLVGSEASGCWPAKGGVMGFGKLGGQQGIDVARLVLPHGPFQSFPGAQS